MKPDGELREDVIRELAWDPQVTDPDAIAVAVKDGAVTLAGRVPAYAEGLAAVRAASRVRDVRAVADELRVQLSGQPPDDSDIARAIAQALGWNARLPEGQVRATVQAGWVTLEGEVGFGYQRREAEKAVRHVRGVTGITNNVVVRSPAASPDRVEASIEQAFERQAEVDAGHIRVGVSGHTVELHGYVRSLREAVAARAAAASAPGVDRVDSHLTVSP
ncbi:MAG TPA: BON domain-containing protein [Streptosporangiaceae bacterium]|jgi:osmotically-inducible protein OsmY|nr:BON domain-containing protein [Streptosporangiaceae bacterium]